MLRTGLGTRRPVTGARNSTIDARWRPVALRRSQTGDKQAAVTLNRLLRCLVGACRPGADQLSQHRKRWHAQSGLRHQAARQGLCSAPALGRAPSTYVPINRIRIRRGAGAAFGQVIWFGHLSLESSVVPSARGPGGWRKGWRIVLNIRYDAKSVLALYFRRFNVRQRQRLALRDPLMAA